MAIKLLPDLETQLRTATALEEIASKLSGTGSGTGAGGGYIDINYDDLVILRDSSSLEKGAFYRITDYETKTIQPETQSAGHLFDIIVQALDEKTISENASAIYSARDTAGYFNGMRLEAWKLKYTLENDMLKYGWANPTDGKGVIYRMIDEYENDLPYDFKNIQFKRYKITTLEDNTEFEGKYYALKDLDGNVIPFNASSIDEGDFIWAYTFTTEVTTDSSYIETTTLNKYPVVDDGGNTAHRCAKNTFGDNNIRVDLLNGYICTLGNNVIYSEVNEIDETQPMHTSLPQYNTVGNNFYSNTIGKSFTSNTIGNNFGYNTIGNGFNSNDIGNQTGANIIGNDFHSNTVGNNSFENIIGTGFSSNTIGNDFNFNTIGTQFMTNTIADGFESNTIGTQFIDNIIGTKFRSNDIAGMSSANTIGNDFSFNTIGMGFFGNTVGNNFNGSSVGSFFIYSTIENGVSYIQFSVDGIPGGDMTPGSFGDAIVHLHLKSGLAGTSFMNKLDLYYDGLYGREYPTTFEIIANGNVVSSWEATPLTRTGKIKVTKTTETWSDISGG